MEAACIGTLLVKMPGVKASCWIRVANSPADYSNFFGDKKISQAIL
jgi:hypothetical protein